MPSLRTASMHRIVPLAIALAMMKALTLDVGAAAAQPAYDQLRVIAPAAPGGGWDQTARVMQQVLQRTGLARTVAVENVSGAAGTIGLARFIGAERGRGDAVMVSGLIMLGAIVTHRSAVTLRDVTPIARLTGEYEVIVVPAASLFRSLGDVLGALRTRPEEISWGGGSAGGSDQILAGLVADAAGVAPERINYIAFSGGGESLSAIVGGQVTVGVNGLAELAAQIDAGTVRVLAISSAERLPGVNAPTLREQGIDVVFENWRSVVAPPGIGENDRHRLAATIEAMVQSREWDEALAKYRWLDRYMAGDAFERFAADEEARVRQILRKLGTSRDAGTLTSAGPYPLFVIAGLVLCAVGASVERFRLRTPRAGEGAGAQRRPIALVATGVVLHLALAERAGFIIASTLLFWLTARAFDEKRPVRDALFAAGVSVGAYLLFARLLDLSLPAGVVERWL
jgi:putative tricarboxylic transport membrane protein